MVRALVKKGAQMLSSSDTRGALPGGAVPREGESGDDVTMTRALAEEAAAQVLQRAWAAGDGSIQLPVDPVEVAARLGIATVVMHLPDDVSGAIIKQPDGPARIYLRPSDTDNRKRFTCAHELGHYMKKLIENDVEELDSLSYIDVRTPRAAEGTDEAEIFANSFAAALLMPPKEFCEIFEASSNRFETARVFQVSADAVTNRSHVLKLSK